MTENQWPQTPEPYSEPDVYAGTAETTPLSTTQGASTKKDAAKEEASNVAGQAADAAQNVAGTAKAEAANVASEVKTSAKDLLHQAKSDLTSQAGAQQQKAAEGIRTISSQLHSMARCPGPAGRRLGPHPSSRGTLRIRGHLAGQQGPGITAGRGEILRPPAPGNVPAAGRRRRGTRRTPWPEPPGRSPRHLLGNSDRAAASAGTAADRRRCCWVGVGEPFYDETTAGAPVYGGTGYGRPAGGHGLASGTGTGPASAQTLPGGTAGEIPLRDVDDPLAEGEGRHL